MSALPCCLPRSLRALNAQANTKFCAKLHVWLRCYLLCRNSLEFSADHLDVVPPSEGKVKLAFSRWPALQVTSLGVLSARCIYDIPLSKPSAFLESNNAFVDLWNHLMRLCLEAAWHLRDPVQDRITFWAPSLRNTTLPSHYRAEKCADIAPLFSSLLRYSICQEWQTPHTHPHLAWLTLLTPPSAHQDSEVSSQQLIIYHNDQKCRSAALTWFCRTK